MLYAFRLKKTVFQLCCVALLAVGFIFVLPAQTSAQTSFRDVTPWRIALIAGGPFIEYQKAMQGFVERLAELKLITDGAVPVSKDDESLALMWKWLADNAGGDKLRFMSDAFYSPEWNPEARALVKQELLSRLQNKGDIDCILAFGTWAGLDIGLESLSIPVLVISATNAVEAGIIPSPDDSGRDNLLAIVDPDRYQRQVRIFHEIIGFFKLGIAYEDTISGQSSIALSEIESAVKEAGVDLLRCTDVFDIEDVELAAQRLRGCHENLVRQGADAVYLTYNQGLDSNYATHVLEPLILANLPTFAQQGSDLVQRGAMLSSSSGGAREEGAFAAETLEKILEGKSPRMLSQRYKVIVSLAVNLRTAALIGWNLPMEILAAVDEFYTDF